MFEKITFLWLLTREPVKLWKHWKVPILNPLHQWETLAWLLINFLGTHFIWERSCACKDIRKKLKNVHELWSETQFWHRFFWFEICSQLLFQSLSPEDWINIMHSPWGLHLESVQEPNLVQNAAVAGLRTASHPLSLQAMPSKMS